MQQRQSTYIPARNTLLWVNFHESLGFMFLNSFTYACTHNKTASQLSKRKTKLYAFDYPYIVLGNGSAI